MKRVLLSCLSRSSSRLDVSRAKRASSHRCASSLQGDSVCNGTHSIKKALLSDPQLFEAQFAELLTELTERDFTDPGLTDALHRLREVCVVCVSFRLLCCYKCFNECLTSGDGV